MASIFEIDNDTPLEHSCANGLTFKTETADLRKGVTVVKGDFWFEDALKMGADFAQFGAWHAMEIRPNLNWFAGYDAIHYTIDNVSEPTREELL